MKRLYIIHGWAYTIKPWQAVVKQLRQAGVQVTMLRVPGLTAPSNKVWQMTDYLDWLDQQLDGIPHPIVLGHSNGGRIALHYCQRHPQRLAHLILVNSAGLPPTASQRRRRQGQAALAKLARPLRRLPRLRRLIYKRVLRSDYLEGPPHMQRTLGHMLAADSTLGLAAITTPISLIWGQLDQITPLWQAQALRTQLPNVERYDVLAGAGHAPYISHPRQFGQLILKHLGEL